MRRIFHWSVFSVVVCVLLVCAVAPWGRTAESTAVPAIAVIDMARVSREAEPVKAAYQELNELQTRYTNTLQELDQHTYLAGSEIDEYALILEAGTALSPAQKQRSAELKQLAADREQEMQRLALVQNPTEEQKKRMQELAQMRGEKEQRLKSVQERYQKAFDQKAREVLPRLEKLVQDTIEAMAKEKKYALVLSKQVQGPMGPEDVVLYGGQDITDDLIKRLNKK